MLELTDDDFAYIVAALILASDEWGDPDSENAKALAQKLTDFHNRRTRNGEEF